MIRSVALGAVLVACFASAANAACGVSAERSAPRVIRAAYAPDAETMPGVAITFLGHASFEIETPGHVSAVTDYNGYNIPVDPPDIATMNHAHSTHYTLNPDPRIAHVLHGWRDDGEPAQIDLTVGDLHVRNLPTNIWDWAGGGTEQYGNSIFVFESAGLCVGHLGHLHHLLTPDDLATLGQLDVVMAPVDGMWTLGLDDMMQVIESLHAPVVIPMHYYDRSYLRRFLARVGGLYPVRENPTATVRISRASLPSSTEILMVPGPPG